MSGHDNRSIIRWLIIISTLIFPWLFRQDSITGQLFGFRGAIVVGTITFCVAFLHLGLNKNKRRNCEAVDVKWTWTDFPHPRKSHERIRMMDCVFVSFLAAATMFVRGFFGKSDGWLSDSMAVFTIALGLGLACILSRENKNRK